MIASDGLRSLSLNDYLQEQDLMARGLKEKPTATSVASSLIAEMGPKDVIEMNLQVCQSVSPVSPHVYMHACMSCVSCQHRLGGEYLGK